MDFYNQSRRMFTGILLLLVLFLSLTFNVRPVAAATIVVDTENDNQTAGDGYCTLREAINNAKTHSDTTAGDCIAGESGVNTITLPAGTYTLDSQIPTITNSEIVINGANAETTIIQASECNPVTLPGGCTPATHRFFYLSVGSNLTLNNLTLRHGSAGYGGAIISYSGTLTITNSILTGNLGNATNSKGGAIYIDVNSTLDISDSTISGNSSGQFGGGIYNLDGTATVTNCTFEDNISTTYGGGIYTSGTLEVSGSTFYENESNYGGGINNGGSAGSTTIISNCSFEANNATNRGGAIENKETVTVTDSTFFANTASNNGGGIYNYIGAYADISTSTFVGNDAVAHGGGIYSTSSAEIHVTNSTLSGNIAGEEGGGIYTYNTSYTYLTNVTLSDNVASTNGGGIYNDGFLEFINTIIANSTGGDCDTLTAPGNILPSSTHNLVEDGTCGADYSGDPMLDVLADNGGPTQTHALLEGSPAIDHGSLAFCPATDQRGVSRPIGGGCDIGAFELEGVLVYSYLPLVLR